MYPYFGYYDYIIGISDAIDHIHGRNKLLQTYILLTFFYFMARDVDKVHKIMYNSNILHLKTICPQKICNDDTS